MPEPTTNQETNQDPGTPRSVIQDPPVKQKTMEASPVTSPSQIDVTQAMSTQELAIAMQALATRESVATETIDYTPGQFQQHKTFVVPKDWSLRMIANHLRVTVEALKEYNKDKLHSTVKKNEQNKAVRTIYWFKEGEVITVPPQKQIAEDEKIKDQPEVKEEEKTIKESVQEEAKTENVPKVESTVSVSEPVITTPNESITDNSVGNSNVKETNVTKEEHLEEIKEENEKEENKLTIVKGELTKISEGTNQYIHWPETEASGVTIGMGYDMGGRKPDDVKKDLIAAGMEEKKATLISTGAEKKGNEAEKFVSDNKTKVGEIDYEIIFKLYYQIVDDYESAAKILATTSSDTNSYTAIGQESLDNVEEGTYKMSSEQWDALHPAMIELLTDLKYQGGTYTGKRLAAVNKVLIENHGNHLEQFKAVKEVLEGDVFSDYMDEQSNKVDKDISETFYGQKMDLKGEHRRSLVRITYLEHIITAMESGKDVILSEDASKLQNPIVSTPNGNIQLGSWVGKLSNINTKGAAKNLPEDVKKVQELLLLIGVLDQASYNEELALGTEPVPEDKLTKTIAAIFKYQQENLHYKTLYGYIIPGKGTIRALSGDKTAIEKEERRKANKITSIVGDQILDGESVNNEIPAINLLNDVKIIQTNLIRLGLMKKLEGDAEPVDPIKTICPRDIDVTIKAIKYFQQVVMGQSVPTGYIEPSDATHIQLVDITSDEFKREEAVFKEKKAEEERIQKIKDTVFDEESLAKLENMKEEELDRFLKDYARYNLKFITQLIDSSVGKGKYFYTTHVIDALSNAELSKLPEDLNNKFYDIVSSQDDFEGNIKYMARLTKGRIEFGLDQEYITKEDQKKDKEKEEKEKAKKKQEAKKDPTKDTIVSLTGTIGLVSNKSKKPWNNPDEIAFVQKLLNNITYIDKKTNTEKKYLEDGAFNIENPNKVPGSPFFSGFDWISNYKPVESYSFMLEKPKSFDQEYSNTYYAIIKFQKDHCSFTPDGAVGSGNTTIKKLVALSNQATKNKEIEAKKKQEAKKVPEKDTITALTGKVGLVAKPNEHTNTPNNIRFVQKLLHNITDKKTGGKYLEDGAFKTEDPYYVPLPENPFVFDFESMFNNKPEEPYYLQEIKSFDQEYSNTYNAIIKFQTDYHLTVDGEVWPNNAAIKKLVALSNQATINKEKEANKKQEAKKESKKDPTKDTIVSLTGTIGLVSNKSKKPWNNPDEIAFVQKLLNNITYIDTSTEKNYLMPNIDESTEKKYLEDGAFYSENPNGSSFLSGLDWKIYTKPLESYSGMLEKPKSFDKEYPNTYDAIIKFQKDHCSFTPDGVIGAGYGTIKKLVALSNQATKNREIAALEKEIAAIAQKESDKLDELVEESMTNHRRDNYAVMLKSELLENPKFVARFITKLGGKAASYQLVKDLMSITSQRDLVKIDANLDNILFDTLYKNGDIKKDIKYLLRLRTGRKKYEVDGPFSTIETIIDIDDWRSQGSYTGSGYYPDNEGNGTACKTVAEKMVYRHLYDDLDKEFRINTVTKSADNKYEYIVGNTGDDNQEYLSLLAEDKAQFREVKGTKRLDTKEYKTIDTAQAALDYLNSYLEMNIPVVVGVDHTFNAMTGGKTNPDSYGYNEGTTDHFITIVGRGTNEEGKRYYSFYDPGTNHRKNATKEENRLVEDDKKPFHWVGTQPYNGGVKSYHLTMVVLFKKDVGKYTDEIQDNKERESSLSKAFTNKTDDFAK